MSPLLGMLVLAAACTDPLDDDPVGGTGEACNVAGGCNGVALYCHNDNQPVEVADGESGGDGSEWQGQDDGDYNYWRRVTNYNIQNLPECLAGERPIGGITPPLCELYSEPFVLQGSIVRCIGPGAQPAGFDPFEPGASDDWENWSEEGYPDIDDFVKDMCTARCNEQNQGAGIRCQDANWTDVRTYGGWDPSEGNNCNTAANLNKDDPDGSEIEWDLVGGSSSPEPVSCDLDGDCADEFYPGVGAWIAEAGIADFITPETRHADFDGVDVTGSTLLLDMSGTNDDTEAIHGFAEYSASDCGDDVCPFYLANLVAYNTSDTWEIAVPTLVGTIDKSIRNIQVDLLQSTLGVLNTDVGYVAFAPGALRFRAEFEVDSCSSCSRYGDGTHAFVVENEEYVFAEYDDGTLDLVHTFSLPSGTSAKLDLSIAPREEPPVAGHDLAAEETCDDPGGLVLDASRSTSTDPDNDIEIEFWWVDGSPAGHGTVLAQEQTYVVALEVRDARGAVRRTADQTVRVLTGSAC